MDTKQDWHSTLATLRTGKALLAGLAVCMALAALLVALAPTERTLGDGIKVVYVHVALSWTGLTALALTGLLGAALLVTGKRGWATWAQTTGWVACGFFATGLAMSLVAARVNWGGVFWQEPRTAASLRALAVAVIALSVAGWLDGRRWAGLLYLLPVALLGWSMQVTPLVLHPQNAVWSSPSVDIRFTFLALFALFSVVALGLVYFFTRPPRPRAPRADIQSKARSFPREEAAPHFVKEAIEFEPTRDDPTQGDGGRQT